MGMLNVLLARSPLLRTLLLVRSRLLMLKTLPLAITCPPVLAVMMLDAPSKVVSVALRVPPTSIGEGADEQQPPTPPRSDTVSPLTKVMVPLSVRVEPDKRSTSTSCPTATVA